ncbi:MAG: heat-inducible transcription repressor HrcA, partial [Acidobacteria bacterium]|nr:heat-inducible transcription repressor HrcA [Acidobacteriota bacterium]
SRTLSDRFAHASGWSPATIRNVMGELEEAGLVEQPHTSAGRIPTDRGYRFYVDHMLGDLRLSRADLATINSLLGVGGAETEAPDRLLEKTSRLLSALSRNVGIVVSPSLADDRLQHIQFVQLADNRILVVLVSAPNIIHNKIVRVDEKLSQEELERTARYLNTEFGGKSLLAIRAEILELMREEKALYDTLLRNAILLCESSLEGEESKTGEVYVDGASNILLQPEFADAERMRELFRTFEEKSRLVKILNECVARDQALPGDVQIVIGSELVVPSMQQCALITAPYRTGAETFGTLSVVGPMRIEYARMISVVNYVARLLERLLREETSI